VQRHGAGNHRRRIDRVVAGTAVDEQLVGGILMGDDDAGGGTGDADAAVELNLTFNLQSWLGIHRRGGSWIERGSKPLGAVGRHGHRWLLSESSYPGSRRSWVLATSWCGSSGRSANQVRGLLRPFGIRLPARQGTKKFVYSGAARCDALCEHHGPHGDRSPWTNSSRSWRGVRWCAGGDECAGGWADRGRLWQRSRTWAGSAGCGTSGSIWGSRPSATNWARPTLCAAPPGKETRWCDYLYVY
jgi:hypothetical protein